MANPGFLRRGRQSERGASTYHLAIFFPKLHENGKTKLAQRAARLPCAFLRSTTTDRFAILSIRKNVKSSKLLICNLDFSSPPIKGLTGQNAQNLELKFVPYGTPPEMWKLIWQWRNFANKYQTVFKLIKCHLVNFDTSTPIPMRVCTVIYFIRSWLIVQCSLIKTT